MGSAYSNSEYWMDLHQQFSGNLRAVGWPELSEELNKIKYSSELDSFSAILEGIRFPPSLDRPKILEVGVGIGFWLAAMKDFYTSNSLKPELTAVDISEQALDSVVDNHPEVHTHQLDLKSVSVDLMAGQFDLVLALMVLLHLTQEDEFNHALRFCASCIRQGGYFLIYEPIVLSAYSPWDEVPCSNQNNSKGRRISDFDDILTAQGFVRLDVVAGASWLTNSPIESATKLGFLARQIVWKLLTKFIYRFDSLSSFVRPACLKLDRGLKKTGQGYSGKFIVYQKKR